LVPGQGLLFQTNPFYNVKADLLACRAAEAGLQERPWAGKIALKKIALKVGFSDGECAWGEHWKKYDERLRESNKLRA